MTDYPTRPRDGVPFADLTPGEIEWLIADHSFEADRSRSKIADLKAENERLLANWARACEANLWHELECPLSAVNNQPRRRWWHRD